MSTNFTRIAIRKKKTTKKEIAHSKTRSFWDNHLYRWDSEIENRKISGKIGFATPNKFSQSWSFLNSGDSHSIASTSLSDNFPIT